MPALTRAARPPAVQLVPETAPPGAIQADMLMVNDQSITVAEVLYALRDDIAAARAAQTPRGFLEWARGEVRDVVRREIGALLVYQEATAGFEQQQRDALDKYVEKRLTERVGQEFGGSVARLEAHLAGHGLTLDVYREWLRRDAVVGQYSREKFLPQVSIRRDEILAYWRRTRDARKTESRRELYMIEAPFERFLEEGQTWADATAEAKAQAKLRAARHVREAHEAIVAGMTSETGASGSPVERSDDADAMSPGHQAEDSGAASSPDSRAGLSDAAAQDKQSSATAVFAAAARQFSRGLKADEGGHWGYITRPLRAPYDEPTGRIFDFTAGQTSEPIEMPDGWVIVHCGDVEEESAPTFEQVQGELRRDIETRRLNDLMNDYMIRLASRATITSLDAFVDAALRRLARESDVASRP